MNKRRDILILMLFLFFFFIMLYFVFGSFSPKGSLDELSLRGGNRIALVKIIGVIYDPQPILEQLEKIEESASVKAVVLRLETPGGSIAASQEIYRKLAFLRDDCKIPIIASMGNVAASGGYYVALGADTIIANPGTITGSIGVIFSIPQYFRLLDKLGVGQEVIKSGKFKDTGTPFRSLSMPEKEYLQGLIDDSYQQFVETVTLERDLDQEQVKQLADGRVYTGRQAQEKDLIDLLGGYTDAVSLAAELGGISGKPQVVNLEKKHKLTIFELLFGDIEEILFLKFGFSVPLRYEMH